MGGTSDDGHARSGKRAHCATSRMLVDGQMKMTLTNANDTHDTVCKHMVEVQRMLRGRARSKHDKHETW
jgi:hypothetical protein